MAVIKAEDRLCACSNLPVYSNSDRRSHHPGTTYTVEMETSKQFLVMLSGSFGGWLSQANSDYHMLTDAFLSWRVALMEKSVALLDFTETDQTVQVHGKFIDIQSIN
jgi:hypothetical protein